MCGRRCHAHAAFSFAHAPSRMLDGWVRVQDRLLCPCVLWCWSRAARDTMLYALCRLLDSLVDTVMWSTGSSAQGVDSDKLEGMKKSLSELVTPLTQSDSDLFGKRMVRPIRLDR